MTAAPTESLIRQYTQGDCSWLAAAIHKRTGWPMVPMRDSHVMVEDPDGNLWDIYGPQHRDIAEVRWGPTGEWDPWVSQSVYDIDPEHLAVADDLLAAHSTQGPSQ